METVIIIMLKLFEDEGGGHKMYMQNFILIKNEYNKRSWLDSNEPSAVCLAGGAHGKNW